MKRRILTGIAAILLANVLAGCLFRARGSYPGKFRVEFDSIGLKKVPMSESGITSYTATPSMIPNREPFKRLYDYEWPIQDKAKEIFHDKDAKWYCEVNFNHQDYYLVNYAKHRLLLPWTWHYLEELYVIKKQTKEVAAVPPIMAGSTYDAFELIMNGTPYLVIYNNYGEGLKYNLSALFVLNTDFEIVYMETLPGALGFGFAHHKEYGNCIVVKTRDRIKVSGKWKTINGDWVYYLPKK